MAQHRDSDRWVTPGVVVAALFVGGLVVLAVIAAVTYLTARGYDPQPVVQLVAQLVTAVGALGSLGLQLVGRRTVAKTERNTGTLAEVVDDRTAKLTDAVLDLDDTIRPLLEARQGLGQTVLGLGVGHRPPPPPAARGAAPAAATGG